MIKKPLNRICPTCKKIIEYKSREALNTDNLILENEVKLTEKSILKLKNRFTKGNKLKKLEILNTL